MRHLGVYFVLLAIAITDTPLRNARSRQRCPQIPADAQWKGTWLDTD
jgi:hypothetical protein